jgi:predicted naringenin-chalcone synthase
MPAYISSIGTAVPKFQISQKETAKFMIDHLPLHADQQHLLEVIYRASGIQNRYSVIGDYQAEKEDFTFFPQTQNLEPFPTVQQRMALYQKEAITIATLASIEALEIANISSDEITHLITVSCTGMYAPGIDIELIEKLGFKTNIERTAINFMGCYAAFNAIKAAKNIVEANPKAKVIVVAVELCSIHLQNTTDEDSLLSNALFGDGAAALIIESEQKDFIQLEVAAQYSDLAFSGKEEMKWNISNHGFIMKLSSKVPEEIEKGIRQLTDNLLAHLNLTISDIDFFAIHPGGKRILEVIEKQLDLTKEHNAAAYQVLKNFGNMSSPTVLFVLKSLMKKMNANDKDKNILSFAFGPGLTLESLLYRVS